MKFQAGSNGLRRRAASSHADVEDMDLAHYAVENTSYQNEYVILAKSSGHVLGCSSFRPLDCSDQCGGLYKMRCFKLSPNRRRVAIQNWRYDESYSNFSSLEKWKNVKIERTGPCSWLLRSSIEAVA